MTMMPIEEGCLALLINDSDNTGEVTVGKCMGRRVDFSNGLYITAPSGTSPLWEVDRKLLWKHARTGLLYRVPYCPENHLMRWDGFENKEVSEHEITVRVLA